MLDIKRIKDDPEAVKAGLRAKEVDCDAAVDRILELDKEQEEQVEERRRDYKTELQELVQRKPDQTLRYEMTGSAGPDHARLFAFRVTLNGEPIGAGEGRSKKEAEQSAARSALKKLQK